MQIERFIVGPLQTNCYQVIDQSSGQSVLIDPGAYSPALMEAVKRYPVSTILLTHGHFDHTAGVDTIVAETNAPVYIHSADLAMLQNPTLNGSFLMGTELIVASTPEIITPETQITFGDSALTVLPTPGHSKGGVTFIGNGVALAGDTLFRLSVGRWDLHGGNLEELMASVRTLIDTLPAETVVYPGHGEQTTIGFEHGHNEFLGAYWQ